MCNRPWCTCEAYDEVEAERDRYRAELERIAALADDGKNHALSMVIQKAKAALNEQ